MNVLNILQYGDLNVIDEILFHRYAKGVSSGNIIFSYKSQGNRNIDLFFIGKRLLIFSLKKLGLKFIIKNLKSYIMIYIILYGRMIRSLKFVIRDMFKKNKAI